MTQRTAQAKQVGASGALDMRQSTLGIELHVLFEVIACQDGVLFEYCVYGWQMAFKPLRCVVVRFSTTLWASHYDTFLVSLACGVREVTSVRHGRG